MLSTIDDLSITGRGVTHGYSMLAVNRESPFSQFRFAEEPEAKRSSFAQLNRLIIV